MIRHPRILAGTALGLLMASAPVGAVTMPQAPAVPAITAGFETAAEAPLLLVQTEADQELTKEELRRLRKQRREAERAKQEEQAPAEAEQAAPAQEEEAPRKKRRERQAEQAQQQEAQPEQAAPAQEEESPRKKRREREAEQAQEQQEAQPEQAAPAQEEESPRKKRRQRQAEQAQEQQEAQPEQAAPAQEEETPRKKRRERQAEERQSQPEQAEPQQAEPAQEEESPQPRRQRDRQRAQEAEWEKGQPEEDQLEGQQPEVTEEPAQRRRERERQRRQAEEAPVETETAPAEAEAAPAGQEAPLFDSQKEAPAAAAAPEGAEDAKSRREQRREERRQRRERREAQPLPENDRAAQQDVQPREIEPVTREEGRRRERAPERLERPEGVEVLREIGERVILELGGGRTYVESDDRPRMRRDARDVYYEDLPRGRVRETIVRPNGTQVVTIRNRYGDIVRRSRITPDGQEYVLVYVDEDNWDRGREWRDPGEDLPPLAIDIPREEYILDAGTVEDPDVYYEFLEQPPVEPVERLYSVDEVKRSARVRDIARRIDLDTINFDFGSDKVAEDQISRLEGVAIAMERMLEKNPAETFLIEGHTDAVGSDMANLALSDRRAEAVAEALTNVFGIPPENLVTQGYGEQYPKIRTEGPERENRRVAMRRITPLVAPVASAQ